MTGALNEVGSRIDRPTGKTRFVLAAEAVFRRALHDAEHWLRGQLENGSVQADTAYLTRWNDQTEQVEMVLGEFYVWPETGEDSHENGQIRESDNRGSAKVIELVVHP